MDDGTQGDGSDQRSFFDLLADEEPEEAMRELYRLAQIPFPDMI